MGNGASTNGVVNVDADKIENARLKLLFPEMRNKLKEKENLVEEQQKKLQTAEQEIVALKKEINQLKSVLDLTTQINLTNQTIHEETESLTSESQTNFKTGKERFLNAVATIRSKRFAVSAETTSKSTGSNDDPPQVVKTPKTSIDRTLIVDAFKKNHFLKHLEDVQVKEIIMCMSLKTIQKEQHIINEGDPGNALFVVKKGKLQVHQGTKILGNPMGPGVLFGELAILYNCTRTASVKALENVEVWTIERRIFQSVMKRTGNQRRDEDYLFLKSVPIFKGLDKDKLYKITEVAVEDYFPENDYIIREGERGDAFYIIKTGAVKVLQQLGKAEPQEIRQLQKGDYFGEKALLSEDVRTASIVSSTGGTHCLVIERETFMSFIGDLQQIREKDYGDQERKAAAVEVARSDSGTLDINNTDNARPISKPKSQAEIIRMQFAEKPLNTLKLIATLGMGGFGRVELVADKNCPESTYALKCLIKQHVVETKQQEHVFNEKKILMSLDSPFIINLYKTYKDKRYVYFLMEVCLGGELWTILRDQDYFEESTSRFYTACVVEAFDYLHQRGVVFRDLKPENLLLDSFGYVKLVDFGFAKKIVPGTKTWTFCGTPEYVAPEIILNKGHDHSADYWSLGVLVYELMTGNPPFTSPDAMDTYNIILRGIDALEFSPLITRNSQYLIKKLCKENPMERLGNQKDGVTDIRKHKWFQGFHWSGLGSRTLKPPIQPKIKNPTDHSNFDYFSPCKDIPPEELSGWDAEF